MVYKPAQPLKGKTLKSRFICIYTWLHFNLQSPKACEAVKGTSYRDG